MLPTIPDLNPLLHFGLLFQHPHDLPFSHSRKEVRSPSLTLLPFPFFPPSKPPHTPLSLLFLPNLLPNQRTQNVEQSCIHHVSTLFFDLFSRIRHLEVIHCFEKTHQLILIHSTEQSSNF